MTAVVASSLADDTPLPLAPSLPSENLSRDLHERLGHNRADAGKDVLQDLVLDVLKACLLGENILRAQSFVLRTKERPDPRLPRPEPSARTTARDAPHETGSTR